MIGWVMSEDLWSQYHKVTFDGPNKLIIVNQGEIEIDVQVDIYSDWKEWAYLRDYLKYDAAMRAIGGDPLPGGDFVGSTYFLINGWKIYIDHGVNFIGNLYSDDGTSPFSPAEGVEITTSTISTLVEKPATSTANDNAQIFV